MKVREINNRKGTYIYDEEYNEFFSDDEVWEYLDPDDISQNLKYLKREKLWFLNKNYKIRCLLNT